MKKSEKISIAENYGGKKLPVWKKWEKLSETKKN